MAVLLIAEHNNKELKPFTLNAVTAASQIDADVHALVIGNNSSDTAKALSELPLVKKVLFSFSAPFINTLGKWFRSNRTASSIGQLSDLTQSLHTAWKEGVSSGSFSVLTGTPRYSAIFVFP